MELSSFILIHSSVFITQKNTFYDKLADLRNY